MGSCTILSLVAALSAASLVGAAPAHDQPVTPPKSPTPFGGDLDSAYSVLSIFALGVVDDPEDVMANWTASGTDVCSFQGISCKGDSSDPNSMHVTGIDLNGFHLGPALSLLGFIDGFPFLEFFHSNSNNFTGFFPSLALLTYLEEIDVSNNQLFGSFPIPVIQPQTRFLDLRYNYFNGPVPDNLITGTNLDVLFLNNNDFEGKIPEFPANCPLMYVTLANNRFSGEIPSSIGLATNLQEILMLNNDLSGTVPEELCALNLTVLDVSMNPNMVGPLGKNCLALLDAGVLNITGTQLGKVPTVDEGSQ